MKIVYLFFLKTADGTVSKFNVKLEMYSYMNNNTKKVQCKNHLKEKQFE